MSHSIIAPVSISSESVMLVALLIGNFCILSCDYTEYEIYHIMTLIYPISAYEANLPKSSVFQISVVKYFYVVSITTKIKF